MASHSPEPAAIPPASAPGRKLTTIDLVGGILCNICKSIFSNKKEFDTHYLQHDTGTEVITYTCVACHLTSTSYPSFRGHCYTMHVIKDRFKCDNCKKYFSKLSALKEHIETIHNFRCNKPNCNLRFQSKKELHVHQILHKNDANKPPYQCQSCGEDFENIHQCEDHIDKHCVFTYPCPICNDNLTKENASKHLTNHFGDMNKETKDIEVEETPEDSSINIIGGILCIYCKQVFKNRIEIGTHISDEHPDKDIVYTCIICNKSYEKYSLYGDHCYYHYSKNKFVCEVCDRTFPRLSLLVVHSNVHKLDYKINENQENMSQKESKCRFCNLLLPDATAALRHLTVHRRTTYTCPVCARKYAEKYLLMKHAPQHFEAVFHMCKVCGKVFAAKNRLIEHVKTHSNVKSYECKFCGKGFLKPYQLNQHLNVHTGARPYVCVACPKTFASLPNWQKHVRRMHNIDPKTVNKPQYEQKTDTEHIKQKQPPAEFTKSFVIKDAKNEINKATKEESKAVILEENYAAQTKKMFDFCDEIMEPERIDTSVVEREAASIAELAPILPEDIEKFVSEMLGEQPANIPREYGPDFGPDEAPLLHVAPQLVAGPPPGAPTPAWEPPVITKVCGGYYGELDDIAISGSLFIDTDIF
ncbi:hypothetical protein NE865_12879 [Phthorimaea operculella]|nr:hypothetical protein NE865_12879 [Phthorimaea operculella]